MEFIKSMNNLNNEVRITMPIQSMNKRIVNELKYKKTNLVNLHLHINMIDSCL